MSRRQPVPETNGATDIKSVVAERPHLPSRGNIVGVDGDGCVHYHSPARDRVWVIDPDPETPIASLLTHEQHVERIWAWIDHTRQCRGDWAELRYHRGSLGAALAETLEGYVDGSE